MLGEWGGGGTWCKSESDAETRTCKAHKLQEVRILYQVQWEAISMF